MVLKKNNNNNLQVFRLLKFTDLSFLQLFPPCSAEGRKKINPIYETRILKKKSKIIEHELKKKQLLI